MLHLHRHHVGLDVVAYRETVVLEVGDPVLAAAAVGVAMDVDDQLIDHGLLLTTAKEQQGGQGAEAQATGEALTHGKIPD
ncbi:hypothetical protein D3C77_722490 [compost metagenome]